MNERMDIFTLLQTVSGAIEDSTKSLVKAVHRLREAQETLKSFSERLLFNGVKEDLVEKVE